MSKPHVLACGDMPDWDVAYLNEHFAVQPLPADISPTKVPNPEDVVAIAWKGHGALGVEIMESFPNLRIIANYGVGYDSIDVAAAKARGIKVTNTPDVLTGEVADLAVGMLIAHARQIGMGDRWVRDGHWEERGPMPFTKRVFGKKAGIVGLGRIGIAIARRLAAFEMPISYTSRVPKDVPSEWTRCPDLTEMASDVDYLVVALAGGPDTAKIVNKSVIEALGPEGMLVNISRGSTIDEGALLDALESGKLGSAALDVFENEPEIDPRFLKLKNVLLQPHQASATEETRRAMGRLMADNLRAFYSDEPLLSEVPETK